MFCYLCSTNLLDCLGGVYSSFSFFGEQYLRTNLFEEEEYDVIMGWYMKLWAWKTFRIWSMMLDSLSNPFLSSYKPKKIHKQVVYLLSKRYYENLVFHCMKSFSLLHARNACFKNILSPPCTHFYHFPCNKYLAFSPSLVSYK